MTKNEAKEKSCDTSLFDKNLELLKSSKGDFSKIEVFSKRDLNKSAEWGDPLIYNILALCEYPLRIKPEPQYRPFKDAKEFEPFWNWFFKHKSSHCITQPRGVYSVNGNIELFNNNGYSYQEIFDKFAMSPTLTGEYVIAGIKEGL